MQDVIIVCAGSYGREVYWCMSRHNSIAKERGQKPPYNILGFINDTPSTLKNYGIMAPVLGRIEDWQPGTDEVYALGLGDPAAKKRITDLLKLRGCHFISLVGVEAIVPPDIQMGEGCFIASGSIVGSGVVLGDFVNIHASMLYSGARIESFSTTTGFTIVEEAMVCEGSLLGSKAVVTRGCEVGAWSKVSSGSVVMENVRPGTTVFGMPAREIG